MAPIDSSFRFGHTLGCCILQIVLLIECQLSFAITLPCSKSTRHGFRNLIVGRQIQPLWPWVWRIDSRRVPKAVPEHLKGMGMHLPGKHLLVEISRLPSILCLQDIIPLPVTQTVLETSGFHKNNLYIENLSAISVMFPLILKTWSFTA